MRIQKKHKQYMRRLAKLLAEFINVSQNQQLTGEDMLYRTQFRNLPDVIENVTLKDDGIKAGLKLSIGFVLTRCLKIMKAYYIIDGYFEKSVEMDWFATVL